MSQNRSSTDQHTVLADAWGHVVGGMEWLQSVIYGEFSDHRSLSAVVADMLVSFVPGVVIVTSARDAVAVILRLATHPEKREDLMEWALLCACLIVIALPIAMAIGGVAAGGVGAIVGGVAGTEIGAGLRAVMLMLIKETSKLVELVLFLQKFMKGDILKFLRSIKFAKYDKALLHAFSKICGKLVDIVKSLRVHLQSLHYFDSVQATIFKLAEWEKKFYNVQQDAIGQIPRALAELDARLGKILAETGPKEAHTVAAGIRTDNTIAALPIKQRIRDTPGKILQTPHNNKAETVSSSVMHSDPEISQKVDSVTSSSLKDKPDKIALPAEGPNAKKQFVADPAIAIDRKRITQLSNEVKILEARAILQPYVEAAKNSTTYAEKQSAMNEIIRRLNVTSEKEKMFWSGDKEIARKIAKDKGKTILEETPGGKVIDPWGELDKAFPWDETKTGPYGWDFWGTVAAEYSKDASGEIEIVQSIKKFPNGGDIWRNYEWPTIVKQRDVTLMSILKVDNIGNTLETIKIKPNSDLAKELFKGK
jgi:hypothetical protein